MLFGLSLLALLDPLLKFAAVEWLFGTQWILVLEGVSQQILYEWLGELCVLLIGQQALAGVIVLFIEDSCFLYIGSVVERLVIVAVLWLRQFLKERAFDLLAVYVFVYVDVQHVLCEGHSLLNRRKYKYFIEIDMGSVNVCTSSAVYREELRLFFELFPQIFAVWNQESYLFRILTRIQAQYTFGLLVLHYKFIDILGLHLILFFESFKSLSGFKCVAIMICCGNQRHVIAIVLDGCEFCVYIIEAYFTIEVKAFGDSLHERLEVELKLGSCFVFIDVVVDVDEFFAVGSVEDEVVLLVFLTSQAVLFLEEDEFEVIADAALMAVHKVLCQLDDLLVDEDIPSQFEEDDGALPHQQFLHVFCEVANELDAGVVFAEEVGR